MADIATLLLDTTTSACQTSECPQTSGVKGLAYKSILSEELSTYGWIHLGRSEAFNSINLWTVKNFLKQE